MKTSILIRKSAGWLKLSRPAFHSVGLFPFILGTLLAWRTEGVCDTATAVLGMLAVIAAMLSTYYAGEYSAMRKTPCPEACTEAGFQGAPASFRKASSPEKPPCARASSPL